MSYCYRIHYLRERGSTPKEGRHSTIFCWSSVKALLVKCPCVHWQPDGSTIHTNKVVPRSRIPRSTSHFPSMHPLWLYVLCVYVCWISICVCIYIYIHIYIYIYLWHCQFAIRRARSTHMRMALYLIVYAPIQ